MKYLSYVYRFISNFAFLAMVYFSLNFLTQYNQRTVVAALVLAYALTRAISAFRSFSFFQKVEKLENEAKRLGGLMEGLRSANQARQAVVNEVAEARRGGEMKAYIDLLFLSLITVLCVAKIVAS
jgi:UDP-3-O-acyl-N-acetylglucosamine deacetylase